MYRKALTAAVLGLFALAYISAPAEPAPGRSSGLSQDVAELVQKLKTDRDNAEPELIVQLANQRSREAMEGLITVYDSMGSIYMKREIVRALSSFDGIEEAEEPALEKIMNVASTSKDRELRQAAIESLGECSKRGQHFLRLIVDSQAEDEVRQLALEQHVQMGGEHRDWYEKVYEENRTNELGNRKKNKKRDKEEDATKRLDTLRLLAFEAMAKEMKDQELVAALEDAYHKIPGLALLELEKREYKGVEKAAREMYENVHDTSRPTRCTTNVVAAGVLARAKGPKEAPGFITRGKKFITPLELRIALADLLSEMDDPKVDKKLLGLVGKGKKHEKLFALRAARNVKDPKMDKALRKALGDKESEIRVAAARLIGERGDTDAVEALQKMAEKAKVPDVISVCLDAISTLREGDEEWVAELKAYAENADTGIRNAAILQLGKLGDKDNFELLQQSLSAENWSTRVAALQGLERLRHKPAVGAIIERMPEEKGRVLHEFADALWRMTGQPFRTSTSAWKRWWEKEQEGFEFISAAELEKRNAEEELRRLKSVSNSQFFGIRIVSQRVIFVIDISGSMAWALAGENEAVGDENRMDIAKRELKKCIEGLDGEALFNVITFNGDVASWLDDTVSSSDAKNRDEALDYVERLDAGGATNLYDAVKRSFEDPDVDTIFILSDGEPTAGAVTDPFEIREHVNSWNEHRQITINTIAVGGEFQILEWLAEDSGGSHVEFR